MTGIVSRGAGKVDIGEPTGSGRRQYGIAGKVQQKRLAGIAHSRQIALSDNSDQDNHELVLRRCIMQKHTNIILGPHY